MDDENETDDIYGGDPRLVDIRRARRAEAVAADNVFKWSRPGQPIS